MLCFFCRWMIEASGGKYKHVWLVIKNVGSLTRVKIKRTSFWVTATVNKDDFIRNKIIHAMNYQMKVI